MAYKSSLTTPDMIILSLLGERPMHGYQLNMELVRREVHDWAEISKPQVYYSLKKLARNGCIKPANDRLPAAGPERRLFKTTADGRRELGKALGRSYWAVQRTISPFLTWLALSGNANASTVRTQVSARREYLLKELGKERSTMAELVIETNAMGKPARLMVELTIRHFEAEILWLNKVEKTLLGT